MILEDGKFPYEKFLVYKFFNNVEQRWYCNLLDKEKYYKLRNREGNKSIHIMLYSRYLIETFVGRILNENETVDHIDGNRQNDTLSNLQIISRELNCIKEAYDNQDFLIMIFKCAVCGKFVYRTFRQYKNSFRDSKETCYVTCSKHCGGITSTCYQRIKPWTFERLISPGSTKYLIDKYFVGVTLDYNKVAEYENILNTNNVKFIKRFY